jgi:tRNA nucleotidyltransferase (CCA-adding enzyme)
MDVRIDMPSEVKTALELLHKNGYGAYIVGGCVRDSILGAVPSDWDIATSAVPDEIIRCLERYRIIETGLKHGTVTAVINGMSIEITTYRIDGVYMDNRRPESVSFTGDLSMDLVRRDFTINAMAYDESIIDFFGGICDIEHKRIRCVGEPDKRFGEDGLRILRALRFASALGFTIEEKTSESIRRNKSLLENISRERIASEFNKIITGISFLKIMEEYREVFEVFIPEIKNTDEEAYALMLRSMSHAQGDLALRLSLFMFFVGQKKDNINKFMRNLKYDRRLTEEVEMLSENTDKEIIACSYEMKKLMNSLGEEKSKKLLIIKKAIAKEAGDGNLLKEIEESEKIIDSIIENNQCWSLRQLQVTGDEIVKSGIPQGKLVGEILGELLDKVMRGELENKNSELLKAVQDIFLKLETRK